MERWLLLWIALAIVVVGFDVLALSLRNVLRALTGVRAHVDRIATPPPVDPHRLERVGDRLSALAEHFALIDVRCRKATIGVSAAVSAWRQTIAGLRGR